MGQVPGEDLIIPGSKSPPCNNIRCIRPQVADTNVSRTKGMMSGKWSWKRYTRDQKKEVKVLGNLGLLCCVPMTVKLSLEFDPDIVLNCRYGEYYYYYYYYYYLLLFIIYYYL